MHLADQRLVLVDVVSTVVLHSTETTATTTKSSTGICLSMHRVDIGSGQLVIAALRSDGCLTLMKIAADGQSMITSMHKLNATLTCCVVDAKDSGTVFAVCAAFSIVHLLLVLARRRFRHNRLVTIC